MARQAAVATPIFYRSLTHVTFFSAAKLARELKPAPYIA